MEDLILSLARENLKVIVVCAGALYGCGELMFHNHFKVFYFFNKNNISLLKLLIIIIDNFKLIIMNKLLSFDIFKFSRKNTTLIM